MALPLVADTLAAKPQLHIKALAGPFFPCYQEKRTKSVPIYERVDVREEPASWLLVSQNVRRGSPGGHAGEEAPLCSLTCSA
jgi:hypothetical protein